MTRIVIAGASRGIGLALAEHAVARGFDVVALVRSPAPPGRLSKARVISGFDVRDATAIQTVAAALAGEPIDILINNAGIIGPKRQSTLDMDFDGFRETLEVNTLGPLRVAQAFLPNLRAARRATGIARIVTISSQMGRMSYASSDRIAYRASKSAVNKVMQGLATDLRPEGIAVRLLHPGWVRTDMGGAGADIDVEDSARGILEQALSLEMKASGDFRDYRGAVIPW